MTKLFFKSLILTLIISCNGKSNMENPSKKDVVKKDTVVNHHNTSKTKLTDLHKVSKDCIETVFKIIESSAEYKELTNGLQERIKQNGGSGYGFMVHVSPNPTLDNALEKGDFYEISVHESYPNRMNNIAFFRFDRHQKMLFKMDITSAEYVEINFDQNLIIQFNKACSE